MLIKPEPVRRDIPHEPGEWMKFRRLSAKRIRKARKARDVENLEVVRVLGGEFAKAFQDDEKDPVAAKRKQKQALAALKEFEWDISNFDCAVLLEMSLDSWSYPDPPGPEPDDQIEEQTLNWAGEEILALSRPRTKEAEKNS
jgi:hypothetical protein